MTSKGERGRYRGPRGESGRNRQPRRRALVAGLLLTAVVAITGAPSLAESVSAEDPAATDAVPTTTAPPPTVAPTTVPATTVPPATTVVVEPVVPAAPAPPPADITPEADPVDPIEPTVTEAAEGGVVADIPLKATHVGGHFTTFQIDCAEILEPGEVLWHFVLGPLAGATNAGTTLASPSWGISGLHPEDTVGGGLQGANADWFVLNTFTTAPSDLVATTDGAQTQTDLRVSHTCSGEPVTETGSLEVLKVVDGYGSPDPGATFTVAVDCDDDDFDETLVFDATGALTSGTNPQTGIPLGVVCTVTETGDGDADAVTYSPDGGTATTPPEVTITDSTAVSVTVTNTFDSDLPDTGSLEVLKVVDGSGSPAPGATFTVAVDCDDDDFDETLVFDATGALTSGTNPQTGIPLGVVCTVTETSDGDADAVTYSPDGGTPTTPPEVTITDSTAVSVTVTNTFLPDLPETGTLDVHKVIAPGPRPPAGSLFTIFVDCEVDAFDRALVFNASGALVSGILPITGIPVGVACTVTETAAGGASAVTYSRPSGTAPTPPKVSALAATTVDVTVTNSFTDEDPGEVVDPPDPGQDPTNVEDPTTSPTPGTTGVLARTGATTAPVLLVALALLGLGTAVLVGRRRLRSD